MLNRNYRRQKNPQKKLYWNRGGNFLFRFLLMTAAALIIVHICFQSVINRSIEYQGKVIASETLSNETIELLREISLSYSDLVTVSRDTEGRITAIETDTGKLNLIKNTLEKKITKKLGTLGNQSYSMPLGTLLGSEWLSGRGPEVPLKLTPMGYLETTVESRFYSAGINQTNHQIVLDLSLDLTTMVPLHQQAITVNTNFIIAETIIVGQVPEYYTNIAGDGASTSSLRENSMDPWDLTKE